MVTTVKADDDPIPSKLFGFLLKAIPRKYQMGWHI